MRLKWSIVMTVSLLMVAVIDQASVVRLSGSAYAQSVQQTPTPPVEGPNDVLLSSETPDTDSSTSTLGSSSGFPVAHSCSSVSSVQGSITGANAVETGRLVRDGQPTTCAVRKTFPGLNDSNPRHYAAHWFSNSSTIDRCYAVAVEGACSGSNMVFFTTYLNNFNAADPGANYLADIGSSPLPTGGYSFIVPAGANFGVIVNEVTQDAGCGAYAFTLSECGCWDTTVIGSIANTDATQTGRLLRDGEASTCSLPKTFPGTTGGGAIHFDSYAYANTTSTTACYRVDVSAPNCMANMMFVSAYLGAYNPADLSANYLADIGSSPLPSGSFSFDVPAGQAYTLIANEVTAGSGCSAYTLNISNCGYQVCLPNVQR